LRTPPTFSGNPNVGAATIEPCSALVRSFSTSAERFTVSRQRFWYVLRPIQARQKFTVSLNAWGT
jgi:hypothetical protein